MSTSDGEAREAARERVAVEAARKALIEDARSARTGLPIGGGLISAGILIATAASLLPVGLIGLIFIGGIGLLMIPFGIAVIARSARTMAQAKRGLIRREP